MAHSENYTFIQYTVSHFRNTRGLTPLTGIYRNDLSNFSPSVNLITINKPIFNIHSGKVLYEGDGNTLLSTVSALDVLQVDPDFDISENDNPLLLKYYLK